MSIVQGFPKEYMATPPTPPVFDGVPLLRRQTTASRVEECSKMRREYTTEVGGQVLCGPMEGLAKKSCYNNYIKTAPCSLKMKTLMKELRSLPDLLECSPEASMFVRFDEDLPSFLRAVLIGVEGTPYASGAFVFDLYCPDDYPQSPPMVTHITIGANDVQANNGPGGFSPNLHHGSGKVCLSLLGTWEGTGWDPSSGSIYQVLSSILWGILGAEHPYYMEPGHGGWEGTMPSAHSVHDPKVIWYTEEVRRGTIKHAILGQLRNPPEGFEGVIRAHFACKRRMVLSMIDSWERKVRSPGEKGAHYDSNMKSLTKAACQDLRDEYKHRMTVEEARKDVEAAKAEVEYIEMKMLFLSLKVAAAEDEAGTKCPKACERLKLGPGLLEAANGKLVAAQTIFRQLSGVDSTVLEG